MVSYLGYVVGYIIPAVINRGEIGLASWELRLKERDARILEQDVQIQDLTNRLSECRSAMDEEENRVLDARRVEGVSGAVEDTGGEDED